MAPGTSDPFLTPLQVDAGPGDISVGSRLGKYEILKRLSVGGMAEIFVARAIGLPGFQKLVVIKRILPQLASKPDFVEMFLDEARIAATLQHPNIVQTYDICVVGGNYFIAMEYLHGEEVRALLSSVRKSGAKVPLEHTLQIVISLSAGLHYAHEKEDFDGKALQIVHRDVTPGNVIVTYEGSVKLLDFGIARATSRFNETRSGTLKGKIGYMSPEQAKGAPLDRRSDVFSVGIILYELSLAKKLYKGVSDFEVLKKIVDGRITPPSKIDTSYDKDLEAIVMKALEHDPARRYQTAGDLQADLEKLARARGIFISPTGLKGYMHELFGKKIEAWKEALAQGKSLLEHVELVVSYDAEDERGDAGAPTVESGPTEQPPPLPLDHARARSHVTTWLLAIAALALVGAVAVAVWPRHTPPPLLPAVAVENPVAPPQPPPSVEEPPPPVAPKIAAPEPPPPVVITPRSLGALKLTTHPRGAALYLDGKKLAQSSNTTLEGIEAGREHTVVAQMSGYKDGQKSFTVAAGGTAKLTINLHRTREKKAADAMAAPPPVAAVPAPAAPAPAPPKPEVLEGEGTLAVASSPWCSVEIDGKDRGQTPISVKLPAGTHTVVLTNPEFKIKRTLSVMVRPNETIRKKLDFAR